MKKNYIILFLLIAFVPFVSAQYFGGFWYGTEQVIDSVVRNLEPLLRALLGGYDWTGYLLFEKVLLFILISIVVGLILQKIPVFESWKSKKILRFVAVIIGLLAVRNVNYLWIGTILVQYQVMFIAIAGILPFMIYWYFLKSLERDDSWIRKTAWIFYAVIYFGLWATTDLVAYEEVYLWGAIVALIYAFFIDTWLMNWIEINGIKKGNKSKLVDSIADLSKRAKDIEEKLADGHYRSPRAERIAREHLDKLEKRIRELQKGL